MSYFDGAYGGYSGGGPYETFKSNLTQFYTGYPVLTFAIIVVLIAIVIWLLVKKEGFNPTATMKFQLRDGIGEHLTDGGSCVSPGSMTGDPWGWMYNVAKGPETFKPQTDGDFSRILAGH